MAATIELVEIYRKIEDYYQNKANIVEYNWKGKNKPKKQSILAVAKTLEEKFHQQDKRNQEKPTSKAFSTKFKKEKLIRK